jgi:uncharacterized membrane protein YccC
MLTVYITSQPLSGVQRAKAVYRIIGTLIGGAAMVAIVPNLVHTPELPTLAIILWVVCTRRLADATRRANAGTIHDASLRLATERSGRCRSS